MPGDDRARKTRTGGAVRDRAELEALWDVSRSLYRHNTLDDLILHIIGRLRALMDAEGVSVILHDGDRDELVFRWAEDEPQGIAERLREVRLPVDAGIAGHVFSAGEAELVHDVAGDARHYARVDDATGFGTRSMAVAPLRKNETTIGVLEVVNKKSGPFEERDLSFLTALAPILAMALDNARMYSELEAANRELARQNRDKDRQISVTQEENARLRREIEGKYRFDQIIGTSQPIREVLALCEKAIESDIPVLIEGETGTGKELVARSIHYNSRRSTRPFVTQNCGGIPETLLESELFGHRKGAFTGATSNKKGLFELADGGTVFLDEIGEMSPAMQTGLLRVLQEGEIKPIGAEASRKVDVRLISATNRDLEKEVAEGRFREDLLYRVNAFKIRVPALRERVEDIPLLARHLADEHARREGKAIQGLSAAALRCLEGHPFPGNVRELENEIRRAIAMAAEGEVLAVEHLSEKLRIASSSPESPVASKGTLRERVEALERTLLTRMIEKHKGNKTRLAAELGLSRYGLSKKLQRYGL